MLPSWSSQRISNSAGKRREGLSPGRRVAAGVIGEVDAHEEDGLVRVAELLAVEDVAAALGDGPRAAYTIPRRSGQERVRISSRSLMAPALTAG